MNKSFPFASINYLKFKGFSQVQIQYHRWIVSLIFTTPKDYTKLKENTMPL